MGFFDDIFGKMFDFNHDGHTSWYEEWIGHEMMMQSIKLEQQKKEKQKTFSNHGYSNTTQNNETQTTIPLKVTIEWPKQELLDYIKESDYPNKRKYYAAYHLCALQHAMAFVQGYTTEEQEKERCQFILSSGTVAAEYLSNREYLYAQAIKENFKVPIEIPDEDEKAKTNFENLLRDIAEKDVNLALDIWVWCIEKFGPYQKYADQKLILFNFIIISLSEFPNNFFDLTTKRLGDDLVFCKNLLTDCPEDSFLAYRFVLNALRLDLFETALSIYKAAMSNPHMTREIKQDFIIHLILDCNCFGDNILRKLQAVLFPIIKEIPDEKIKQIIKNAEDDIAYYDGIIKEEIERQDALVAEQKEKAKKALLSEQRLKNIISRVQSGEVWDKKTDVHQPDFIKYTFTWPDGKVGDVNMYIAGELGSVQQVGTTEYSVSLPTSEREMIALLQFVYTIKWDESPRNELQNFMYEFNLYHRLRQECDDFMRSAPNRQNHPLREQGRELANNYIQTIRDKRKQIYSKLVVNGQVTHKWVSEQRAYNIIKSLYPDALYQYTSDWLGGQSLDIFIPKEKIAIEYQGAQHYMAIDFFGGEKGLAATLERDKAKKKKCEDNGVTLIEWRFDEPLTVEYIQNKLLNLQ